MDAQLDIAKTIWITEKQLGTIQVLRHRGNNIQYRLPPQIETSITLRFKGRGQVKNNQAGNLMLNVRVDRGRDQHRALWISETDARSGCLKTCRVQKGFWGRTKPVQITIPILSCDGGLVRVRGGGQRSKLRWDWHLFDRPKGDLIVKLHVFPDSIKAFYRQVDALKTEDLALEGWVYRHRDKIWETLGSSVQRPPVRPSCIADTFNSGGWRAIRPGPDRPGTHGGSPDVYVSIR